MVAARESVPSIHRSHSSAGGGLGRAQQQQPDTRLEFGCPTLCSAATGSGGAGVQSTAGHGAGVHGRVAGWQYGGGADTRCWLHVEAARWPGVGRGRVARVQLVSRCWVWPGCVSNMKDMTCASSSRARPDPDKWPPAQPAQPSPASPAQAAILQAAGDCAVCTPAPPQQAGCLCWWWPSLCLTAARSVTSHQQPSLSQPPVTSSSRVNQ